MLDLEVSFLVHSSWFPFPCPADMLARIPRSWKHREDYHVVMSGSREQTQRSGLDERWLD